MNIAIFGGSFDPPHLGHLSIANEAIKSLDIEKLIIVPTFLNPFKNEFNTSPKKRILWIKKVFENNNKIDISSYEIDNERATPSIETVKELSKVYKPNKIYLIIGADNVQSLQKWYKYDELEKLVTFVIANRDEIEVEDKFIKLNVNCKISSTQLRKSLKDNDNKVISFLPEIIKEDILKEYSNE